MNALRFSTLALLLLIPSLAGAERIYQLVDYPELQNGYTLSGTITTTDEAPDDGMLAVEEIVDWEWASTGPAVDVAVTMDLHSSVFASNISITHTAIALPLDSSASLRHTGSSSPIALQDRILRWVTYRRTSGYISYYTVAYPGFDEIVPFWRADIDCPEGDYWVVAKYVPEPAASLLIVVSFPALVVLVERRST